jgi:hypothetical protein
MTPIFPSNQLHLHSSASHPSPFRLLSRCITVTMARRAAATCLRYKHSWVSGDIESTLPCTPSFSKGAAKLINVMAQYLAASSSYH